MTTTVWRIAMGGRNHEAHDLSGKGAQATGGRWNRPGRPLVYASTSIALACLETVVHLGSMDLPLNRFLVEITIPEAVWKQRQTLSPADLPIGWNAIPEGKVSLDLGDDWLQGMATALLLVPSAIVPEELNVLVNPAHPQAQSIRSRKRRPWLYDSRLVA